MLRMGKAVSARSRRLTDQKGAEPSMITAAADASQALEIRGNSAHALAAAGPIVSAELSGV